MHTYQDLLLAGDNDINRGLFCRSAVNSFMSSDEYKQAKDGEAYYNKHNITIESYKKFLYTVTGRKVEDIYSANYKLKTLFFRRLVTQQVQYVLGNGVTLQEESNKERLGKDFDYKLQTAAKRAMAGGRAFGFWNLDHLEVFGFADTPTDAGFCPLYDQDTAELMAGIRYWFRQAGDKVVFRCTLYEADGYTDYVQKSDGDMEVYTAKRAYKNKIVRTEAGGIEEIVGENYTKLPIVCLYANDSHESELQGIRECIDCYDFIKSGLANTIDDTSGIYWAIKNSGGMDDADLARFVQRLKLVNAASVDEDGEVSAHTVDVPVEARRTMLETLRSDIYEDFQALDVKSLSAAAKTTQEIQAAYQAQDNKCADFEYNIIDFVQKILELAGINDNPTFTWNRVVNMQEQTSTVLSAANYLTPEIIVKHLPFLTPEEADDVINDLTKESYEQFNGGEEEKGEEEENKGLEDDNEE